MSIENIPRSLVEISASAKTNGAMTSLRTEIHFYQIDKEIRISRVPPIPYSWNVQPNRQR
jgi:hypothetical protein